MDLKLNNYCQDLCEYSLCCQKAEGQYSRMSFHWFGSQSNLSCARNICSQEPVALILGFLFKELKKMQ